MLDSNYNKLVVCKFYLTVHRLHARVQNSICTTYGKYLRESKMAMLTLKSGIHTNDSTMCEYFCIGSIDFMLKGNSLLDHTNLFSPKKYEKNDKMILKYL